MGQTDVLIANELQIFFCQGLNQQKLSKTLRNKQFEFIFVVFRSCAQASRSFVCLKGLTVLALTVLDASRRVPFGGVVGSSLLLAWAFVRMFT